MPTTSPCSAASAGSERSCSTGSRRTPASLPGLPPFRLQAQRTYTLESLTEEKGLGLVALITEEIQARYQGPYHATNPGAQTLLAAKGKTATRFSLKQGRVLSCRAELAIEFETLVDPAREVPPTHLDIKESWTLEPD